MNKKNKIIKTFILKKKINDKYNIIPFNIINSTLGLIKHSPAATKEWFNSVYSFNKNSVKGLTIANNNLSKIIKSYFNFYLKNKIIKNNKFLNNRNLKLNSSTKISTRFRRLTTNKVFISKAELKHTSSKVFITLHVYNQQRINILKKIKIIEKLLFYSDNNKYNAIAKNSSLSLHDKLNLINNNNNNNIKIELLALNLIESQLSIVSIVKNLDTKIINNSIMDLKKNNLKLKELVYNLITIVTNNVNKKKHLEKEIFIIAYYKLLLNLNKFKFEDKFLLKLKPLINRLYNKEVEFNIINLKTLYLNSDILTEIIALKLKNRNNRLLTVLKSSLSIIKLRMNNVSENYHRFDVSKSWDNNVKNLKLNSIINKYSLLYKNTISSKKDVFNKILSLFFVNSYFVSKNVENKLSLKEDNNISKFVLNLLKHKKMAGVRLEAKGRLTRRFTASRSVFKIKWKGTLKNIDATYRGLSSPILRGNIKSNVQYSIVNSKTRNGAFGLKGWISGK